MIKKRKKNYDLVFNLLFEKEDMDKNTLFRFWDILRCMDGELSCIEQNNFEAKWLKRKNSAKQKDGEE